MKTILNIKILFLAVLAIGLFACNSKDSTSSRSLEASAQYAEWGGDDIPFPAQDDQRLVLPSEMEDGVYTLEAVRSLIGYSNSNIRFRTGFRVDVKTGDLKERFCIPSQAAQDAQSGRLIGVMSESNALSQAFIKDSDLVETKYQFLKLETRRAQNGKECRLDVTWDTQPKSTALSLDLLIGHPDTELRGKVGHLDLSRHDMRAAVIQTAPDHFVVLHEADDGRMKFLKAFLMKRTDLPEDYEASPNEWAELLDLVNQLEQAFTNVPSSSEPGTEVVPQELEIHLEDFEREFIEVQSGEASARDASGRVIRLRTQAEATQYARSNRLRADAAEDMWKLSSDTGGVLSFASSTDEVGQAILDQIGHMKNRMNANSGDLDVVFVLDYSGSMSNKIATVIAELQNIAASLDQIMDSSRTARVGIVTFGAPGRERVDLDFTRDMSEVQSVLEDLLTNFRRDTHFVEPGEACYHGVLCGAEQMSWRASNRQMILITDEPSWELRTGDTRTVERAYQSLNQGGIRASIYTIVTR